MRRLKLRSMAVREVSCPMCVGRLAGMSRLGSEMLVTTEPDEPHVIPFQVHGFDELFHVLSLLLLSGYLQRGRGRRGRAQGKRGLVTRGSPTFRTEYEAHAGSTLHAGASAPRGR